MALLRSCTRVFERVFVKVSPICPVRRVQRCLWSYNCRGYVYVSYKKIYNNEKKNGTQLSKNLSIENNSIATIELQNRLDLLQEQFNELRVDYQNLSDTLRIYSTMPEEAADIDQSIGLFLLQCSGKVLPDIETEIRKNFTQQVWKFLQKKNPQLPLEFYHMLLKICAENSQKIDCPEFLKTIPTQPDENTFTNLLNVAAKTHDVDSVRYLLMKMQEKNFSLTPESLCKLIEFYSAINDIESANRLIKTVETLEIIPPEKIYGHVACGYASVGDLEKIQDLLKTYAFDNEQLMKIVQNLNASGVENIEEILKHLKKNKLTPDPLTINTIVKLIHSGKLNDALTLMNLTIIDDTPCKEVRYLKKHFIKAMVWAKYPVSAITMFTEKLGDECTINLLLHCQLEASLHSAYEKLALASLEQLNLRKLEIRPHYYWPLLILNSSSSGEHGVFMILNHMTKMNVELDHRTLVEYVIPHINTGDLENTLKKMKKHGIPENNGLIALTCYFLTNKKITQALLLLNKIDKKIDFNQVITPLAELYKLEKNHNSCVNLLKFANKDGDFAGKFLLILLNDKKFGRDSKELHNLLKEYQRNHIKISSTNADLIFGKLMSFGNDETINLLKSLRIIDENWQKSLSERLSGIPHPKDMNEEELECHLIELKSKGFNVRGVLRKLFMVQCKNKNLKRVEELRKEFTSHGCELTPGMKAQLIQVYAHHGCIGNLCQIIVDLMDNHPDFKMDGTKILGAATALVQHKKIDIALEIINNINNANKDRQFQRQCWHLLNAMAHSERREFTQLMLEVLVNRGFCRASNKILGPIVRQHLIVHDLPNAVNAFRHFVQNYKETPLRQELVTTLVREININSSEKNKIMLQEVLHGIVNIHGKSVADMDLIIGYAQCDMIRHLQSTLQNSSSKNIRFDFSVSALPDDKTRFDVLTRILNASRQIESVDRHSLYELLLSIICRSRNCDDAIGLWEKMRNEGLEPSTIFETNFKDFLQAHRVPLPHNYERNDKKIHLLEKN